MKSCRPRLGPDFKRGRRLPPYPRSSAVGAVWFWPRLPRPDVQKVENQIDPPLPGAGLRISQFHRITFTARVAPWPGVLIPPSGQLIPEVLPGGRVAVKDPLTHTLDARVSPTRFAGIIIPPAGSRSVRGAIHRWVLASCW